MKEPVPYRVQLLIRIPLPFERGELPPRAARPVAKLTRHTEIVLARSAAEAEKIALANITRRGWSIPQRGRVIHIDRQPNKYRIVFRARKLGPGAVRMPVEREITVSAFSERSAVDTLRNRLELGGFKLLRPKATLLERSGAEHKRPELMRRLKRKHAANQKPPKRNAIGLLPRAKTTPRPGGYTLAKITGMNDALRAAAEELAATIVAANTTKDTNCYK